jgi:guanylate kinase
MADPRTTSAGGAGLILTGPRGAGKTTLARELMTAHPDRFAQPVGVTTRAPRAGDGAEYRYLTEAHFLGMRDAGQLFVHSGYAGSYYGFAYDDIAAVHDEGRTPILTLTPRAALEQLASPDWRVVWVDAADGELDQRLAQRPGDPRIAEEQARRTEDRVITERFPRRLDNTGRLTESVDYLVGLC